MDDDVNDANGVGRIFSRIEYEDWPRLEQGGSTVRTMADARARRRSAGGVLGVVLLVVAALVAFQRPWQHDAGRTQPAGPVVGVSTSTQATPSPSASPTTSGTSAGTDPTAPTSAPPVGPLRCTATDLSVTVSPGDPGAGQRYATIELVNTSANACVVQGFGGASLLKADGTSLATTVVRSTLVATKVVLARGDSATSVLHWSPLEAKGDCTVVPVTLAVIPPDETQTLTTPWTGGAVCDQGTVDQSPYVSAAPVAGS